jgi:3,4-dihydroxy-2-butanone 4-phosphate synthase
MKKPSADRVMTVKTAIADYARHEDYRHPGYIFPLNQQLPGEEKKTKNLERW